MIDPHLYLAFVAAVAALMAIPGPNVALIVANSVAHGRRYGLLTVAGTSAAMVFQLGLTALGMSRLLGQMGAWFEAVRWVGVAYLLWLGVTQFRAPPAALDRVEAEPRAPRAIVLRGFLVSLTNPKTLFFYGAFFPQFVSPAWPLARQLGLLAATFLALALLIDGLWALLAARLRPVLARRGRLRSRLSGAILIGAGLGLASVKR